ncbi:hypothetical protein DRH14_03105 [Candidatus Shapirobacteria bacterium]|nr:MAG: hypothetical protein DRH14_03105 [Candidatus Shapirobacteria bacterium]
MFKLKRKIMSKLYTDIFDLATAKVYAVGRRSVWRDYFDLYFILKNNYIGLDESLLMTETRYGSVFSQKLFMEQLAYFGDIKDFSIEYGLGQKKIDLDEVKSYLLKVVKNYSQSHV